MDEEKAVSRRKFTIVHEDIIAAARAYIEATGLPNLALPSVVASAKAYFGLKRQINRELRLPPDKKKSLVTMPGGYVLSDPKLKEAEEFSRTNEAPLSCLYITKKGGIAIKATGWRAKLQADARCMRAYENVKSTQSTVDGKTIYTFEGDLVFWNGDRFHATGSASSDEDRADRTPLSWMLMIAETRMDTRLARKALGLPFDIAEDIALVEVEAPPATAVIEVPSPVTHITSAAEFLARVFSEKKLRLKDILTKLQVLSLGEITDYNAAFEKL